MTLRRYLSASLLLSLLPLAARATPAAPLCGQVDLRAAAQGSECATTGGHIFKLMHRSGQGKEFWLDRSSGLIWGDKLSVRIRRREAAKLCAKGVEGETSFGSTKVSGLPTLANFQEAEARGFREVLPNMREHFYWADSEVPGAANIGHVFNGSLGKPEPVVYRSINFENIRCVGKAQASIR